MIKQRGEKMSKKLLNKIVVFVVIMGFLFVSGNVLVRYYEDLNTDLEPINSIKELSLEERKLKKVELEESFKNLKNENLSQEEFIEKQKDIFYFVKLTTNVKYKGSEKKKERDKEDYLRCHKTHFKDCAFKNDCFIISISGDYYLGGYIKDEDIYLNFDIFEYNLIDIENLNQIGRYFYDFIEDSTVLSDKEIEQIGSNILDCSESGKINNIFLPIIYRNKVAKPVIYLYNEYPMDVHVGLNLKNSILTFTYPEYNNGWDITVLPSNKLTDKQGKTYSYLFWEAKSKEKFDTSKGFVVDREDYVEFFENKLFEIGLNDIEINDFITYWIPQCIQYPYLQVSFVMEEYENSVELSITPKPDNILRVFVVLKGLDTRVEIEKQDLSYYKGFSRDGFTAVEWGGSLIED